MNIVDNLPDHATLLARLAYLELEHKRLIRRAKALARRRSKVEIALAAATRELDLRRRGSEGGADATDHRFVAEDFASAETVTGTIAEACDYTLRRANRPLTVHQILEVFDAAGRDVSGPNAHRIVYATLRRNQGRFTRISSGRFALLGASGNFDDPDEMSTNRAPGLNETVADAERGDA